MELVAAVDYVLDTLNLDLRKKIIYKEALGVNLNLFESAAENPDEAFRIHELKSAVNKVAEAAGKLERACFSENPQLIEALKVLESYQDEKPGLTFLITTIYATIPKLQDEVPFPKPYIMDPQLILDQMRRNQQL